jgi:hypothetical protein
MGAVLSAPLNLRELKGAPLSLLLALRMAGKPVSQGWLERQIGYTDKPVRQALAYLVETGWARHGAQGWELVAGRLESVKTLVGMSAVVEDSSTTRKVSALNTTTTSKTAIKKVNLRRRIPTRSKIPKKSGRTDKTGQAEVLQALLEAGISEPKRSQLAALPGLSAEAVQAWERQLKQAKGERYQPGLLVHVLESGDQLPRVRSRQDYADWERGGQ